MDVSTAAHHSKTQVSPSDLPLKTRIVIVLVCLIQGCLLYLCNHFSDREWMIPIVQRCFTHKFYRALCPDLRAVCEYSTRQNIVESPAGLYRHIRGNDSLDKME